RASAPLRTAAATSALPGPACGAGRTGCAAVADLVDRACACRACARTTRSAHVTDHARVTDCGHALTGAAVHDGAGRTEATGATVRGLPVAPIAADAHISPAHVCGPDAARHCVRRACVATWEPHRPRLPCARIRVPCCAAHRVARNKIAPRHRR